MNAFAYNVSAGKDVSSINPRLIINESDFDMTDIKLPTNYQFVNLTGERYGRLIILEYHGKTPRGSTLWMCKCDCGVEKVIRHNALRSGGTKSCGCFLSEASASRARRKKTHGMSSTSYYRVWIAMIQRCTNPNAVGFHNYGGRGISVCDRWMIGFEESHVDMGTKPNGTQIDRIDNNGNYEPLNCRWATKREQANNRSTNTMVLYDKKNLSLADWARELKVSYNLFRSRVYSLGSPISAIEYYQNQEDYHVAAQ